MRPALYLGALIVGHSLLCGIYRFSTIFSPSYHGYLTGTVLLLVCALAFIAGPSLPGGAGTHAPEGSSGGADGMPGRQRPGASLRRSAVIFIAILALLPGIYLRYRFIAGYAIDPRYGDMLPLAQSACNSFLNGENPYNKIHYVPHPLPLTFMPLLWLSYMPAVVLQFDLRLVGLAATGLILTVFVMILWAQGSPGPQACHSPGAGRRGLAFAAIFLAALLFDYSTAITAFTMIGHTQPLWLYVTLFSYYFYRDKPNVAAVFLGLSLASRQTLVVLLPFVMIYCVRNFPIGKTARAAAILAGVTTAACLPFALHSPGNFFLEPLRHYVELGRVYMGSVDTQHHVLNTFGFSSLFYLAGMEKYLGIAGILAWAAMTVLGAIHIRGKSSAFAYMGSSLCVFYMFAPIPWFYVYVPALLLMSFCLVVTVEEYYAG